MADTVQIVAGWDHDAPRAQGAQKNLGIQICDTAEELLGRSDVDAVIIAAETSMHAELAVASAQAGKPIVMQKPLCLTLAQADQIVEAVNWAGVPFTLAWQMRVDPQNLRMKQLIEEGTLGRITMLRRKHGLTTQFWPDFDKSWHVKKELNRGMWADDAAHPIDFIYWMLGKPVSVMAEIDTLLNPNIPDDQGIAIFKYADGTYGEVCCSFTCVAGENTTEIVGERGTAIQNYGDGPSCGVPRPADAIGLRWWIHGSKQWVDSGIASPPGHGDRIFGLAGPLIDFLQGRRPSISTAEEGRDALLMTLACHESAEIGQRIKIG